MLLFLCDQAIRLGSSISMQIVMIKHNMVEIQKFEVALKGKKELAVEKAYICGKREITWTFDHFGRESISLRAFRALL